MRCGGAINGGYVDMDAVLVGQLLGTIIGLLFNAAVQKVLLKYLFRSNPPFFRLLMVLFLTYLALSIFGFFLATSGSIFLMGAFTLFAFLSLPLAISSYVPTVEGKKIAYGAALASQLVQLIVFGGLIFLISVFD